MRATLYGTLVYPDTGEPIVYATVDVRLVAQTTGEGLGHLTDIEQSIGGHSRARPDPTTGRWEVADLACNDDPALLPEGTVYEVVISLPADKKVVRHAQLLTARGAEQWLGECLVDPPGALPPAALGVETAARIAADLAHAASSPAHGYPAPSSLVVDADLAAAITALEAVDGQLLDAIVARLTQAQGDARYRLLTALITAADIDTTIARTVATDALAVRSGVAQSIGLVGDSITFNGHSTLGANAFLSTVGYLAWAQLLLGAPFDLSPASVVAAGGFSTAALLALPAFQALLDSRPRWIVLHAGTNDISGGATEATTQTAMQEFVSRCSAVGATPVLTTILPSTAHTGALPQQRERINRWIAGAPRRDRNVLVVDWASRLADGVAGLPRTSFFIDGTHPNAVGAEVMGRAFADAFRPLVRPWSGLPTSQTDNLLGNGLFDGDAGVGLATGWTQLAQSGTPGQTFAKIARSTDPTKPFPDGPGPGSWQKVTCTALGVVRLRYTVANLTLVTGRRHAACLAWRNAAFTSLERLNCYVFVPGGNVTQAFVQYGTAPAALSFPPSGVMRTPPAIGTATTGSLLFDVYLSFIGSIEITGAAVRLVEDE